MIWRNPLAWLGLLTLAIPIAIHLLVRARARTIDFPSLRFVQASRLAAIRRRTISDWLLLAVRVAILACATAALADPLLLTASRRDAWTNRTVRALVVDTSASMSPHRAAADDIATRETRTAANATRIDADRLPAALDRARAWLADAPPGRREIIVISDFQRDALGPQIVAAVPAHIGLRFIRAGTPPATADVDLPHATRARAPGFAAGPVRATLTADEIRVTRSAPADASAQAIAIVDTATGVEVPALNLRVIAREADRPAARAAVEAVLATGAFVADADRALEVRLPGSSSTGSSATAATPADARALDAPWMASTVERMMRARETHPPFTAASANGALVLSSTAPASSPANAMLIRAALAARVSTLTPAEADVQTIPDATLRAWTRPAAELPASEWQRVESFDRRWFWLAALIGLALETWLRRTRRPRPAEQQGTEEAHDRAA